MRKLFYRIFRGIRTFWFDPFFVKVITTHDGILDKRTEDIKACIAAKMPDNLVLSGYKCYSSLDEDGIIEKIFKVIQPSKKTFFEIGCGKGIENNSHFLLLNKWKGVWVDGNKNFIDDVVAALGGNTFKNLLIKNCFVTKDNVKELFHQAYSHFHIDEIDFFSLDIDGNDYHIMEIIFNADIFPKAICVEYNAKWGIYTNVKVKYDPAFVWAGDDYMGVSLGAWVSLFSANNYTLVCCDIAGNNAFFIKDEYKTLFTVYSAEELYQPSRYYLTKKRAGHKSTLKMLKNVLNGD